MIKFVHIRRGLFANFAISCASHNGFNRDISEYNWGLRETQCSIRYIGTTHSEYKSLVSQVYGYQTTNWIEMLPHRVASARAPYAEPQRAITESLRARMWRLPRRDDSIIPLCFIECPELTYTQSAGRICRKTNPGYYLFSLPSHAKRLLYICFHICAFSLTKTNNFKINTFLFVLQK